jgi:hypothetical protein
VGQLRYNESAPALLKQPGAWHTNG